MKLHIQKAESISSRSISPSSHYLTPRKFGSSSFKGLNLTISKQKESAIQNTRDTTTMTPVSSTRNLQILTPVSKSRPVKHLFSKDSPCVALSPNLKNMRNKSLPAFNFDKSLSGFTTISKPYNKLSDYSTSTHKNPELILTKFSPLTETQKTNIMNFSHQKIPQRSLKQEIPLIFQTSIKKKEYSPESTNKKQSASPYKKQSGGKISEIFLVETPKKSNQSKESSTLKNLRKRITKTILDEGPMTVSSKGRFESDKKTDLQFSLHSIEQKQQTQNNFHNMYQQNNCFKKSLNDRIDKGTFGGYNNIRSKRQRDQFFNLTPKVQQELTLDVFELTESNKKISNKGSSLFRNPAQKSKQDISAIKPIKRKLTLQSEYDKTPSNQIHQPQELNQSMILNEILSSLNKTSKDFLSASPNEEKKLSFTISLIRKCSQSLCLVKNYESNCLFGLMRLNRNEEFIQLQTQGSSLHDQSQLCLKKYLSSSQFVLIQPFEYTLEEIFQMKLIDQKEIPQLIKKFHKTLNQLKQKQKGKINLQRLKERIVYTHGQFRLIPILQKS